MPLNRVLVDSSVWVAHFVAHFRKCDQLRQSLLAADRVLWTIDKNLDALAQRLDIAFGGFNG